MQHIMQTIKQEHQELAYRVYVTDSLRALGAGGHIERRFIEIVDTKFRVEPDDNRTADEIISTIKGKLARLGG